MPLARVWVVAPLSAVRRRLESAVRPPLVAIGSSPPGPPSWLEMRPDLILAEGVEAASGDTPWVLLTDPPAAAEPPVRGLLPRDASPEQIGAALEACAQGLLCLHPAFSESPLPAPGPGLGQPPALTARERDVLVSLAAGLGNKEIAAALGVSESTVKFHLSAVFSKLEVGSRTEAVTAGLRQGLVML